MQPTGRFEFGMHLLRALEFSSNLHMHVKIDVLHLEHSCSAVLPYVKQAVVVHAAPAAAQISLLWSDLSHRDTHFSP